MGDMIYNYYNVYLAGRMSITDGILENVDEEL
jgi:hypothetical protein